MKAFIISALAACAQAFSLTQVELRFVHHLAEHNKQILSLDDYATRLTRFQQIDDLIELHNESPLSAQFLMGHNKFSDWSEEEFRKLLGRRGGSGA